MPPQFLFDITGIDLSRVIFDREAIRQFNPQRGHMEQLDGIVFIDEVVGRVIGFKDVRDDEFWVAGHIPGRPLLPGVIMIECGAQLASFYTRKILGWTGFIGFGGVEECKFRRQVSPGQRLYLIGQKVSERHRRMCCQVQGIVDGAIAFEAKIVGTQM